MTDFPPISGPRLATLLGVTDRQVRRLAQSGVLPRVGSKFDLAVCVPAYIAYLNRGGDVSNTVSESRLRLMEAQRREIEARTRRAERREVAIDEVGTLFEAAMALIGTQLDGLGRRTAGELSALSDPAAIQARLFDETRRIRNAAADQLEALASDSAGRDSAAGAAPEVA